MIYIKIRKNVYNNLTLNKLKEDYPSYYRKFLALHRILSNLITNDLKDYPEIDIVISDKNIKHCLGRFLVNKNKGHKEYKFIAQKTGNPYIVLFSYCILDYFNRHNVKGFKETFLHEFYHFKQWLLNEPLKHNRIIHSADNFLKVDTRIKTISEALNKEVKK